jgi:hypothetical protein
MKNVNVFETGAQHHLNYVPLACLFISILYNIESLTCCYDLRVYKSWSPFDEGNKVIENIGTWTGELACARPSSLILTVRPFT